MDQTLFHIKLNSLRAELNLSWEEMARLSGIENPKSYFYWQGVITENTNTASVEKAARALNRIPIVYYRVLDRHIEDLGIEPFDTRSIDNYTGRVFQKHRRRIGRTQYEIADMVGIAQPTYNEYERGVKRPRVHVLENLCKELGLHPVYLLREVHPILG